MESQPSWSSGQLQDALELLEHATTAPPAEEGVGGPEVVVVVDEAHLLLGAGGDEVRGRIADLAHQGRKVLLNPPRGGAW